MTCGAIVVEKKINSSTSDMTPSESIIRVGALITIQMKPVR